MAQLRRELSSLGLVAPEFLDNDALAVFDADVDGAVRAFQQKRQLIVDGVVGPATQRALLDARWRLGDRTLSYTLSAPMTGDDVADLQMRLSGLGFNTGRPDGLFGDTTDAAVRQFQRDSGLPEDGVFGADTARELGRMTRRPLVTGGRPHYLREYDQVRTSGPRLRGKRIVIDPAHGDGDPGWVVDAVRAADLVFDVARRLEGRMTATGMSTFLTRGPGQNPSAEERAARANSLDADLLISLHIDGTSSPKASGMATFHFGTDSGGVSTVGENLAELVHRELVARTRLLDCRIHHAAWDLLRLTKMPAVQVELGYLTNDADRNSLLSPEFRNTIAEGLLVAIKRLYMDGRDEPQTGTYTMSDLLAHEESVRGLGS
ncbi:N-acetylmuramoyl-L-alanine amidase [Nakamurella lactea]|uniref:N-acetylmuramoyl-L-alanine amidase n=1 Tax=Nakamurella lactea TaxID=459515 RepID=UPI001FE1BC01|nr:N-acetylmuramoyl-L-alanine amidase [Nakamurella lactea]